MRLNQYDWVGSELSIGCSDEAGLSPLRTSWDADRGFDASPIRDVRMRSGLARGSTGTGTYSRTNRPDATRTKPCKSFDEPTMTQQAVRDYRRAWASIQSRRFDRFSNHG